MSKQRITILLLSLSFLLRISSADAENYYFKNLDVNNGLSQNTVNAILQDNVGFMWFGTKDGLNRYDGTTIKTFRHEFKNKKSIGNSFVTVLFQDNRNRIWIGTDAGVYIYQANKESFKSFEETSNLGTKIENTVSDITSDKHGNIWIAVERQGLFCYNIKTGKLTNNRLKNFTTNVKSITFDNSGKMWIGFYGGGLFYSADGIKKLSPYRTAVSNDILFKDDIIMKIIKGPFNCLYISSIKNGVQQINLTSGVASLIMKEDETGESVFCRNLLFKSDNELAIGTESGVYIYNLYSKSYVHIKNSPSDNYSLSNNAVYSLYKDKSDGIWIGSYFGGVDYFPKSYTYFEKYYPKFGENSLRGMRVREFCQDKRGIIWIGTEDGGLNYYDPKSNKISFFSPSSDFTNIHGLCLIGDNLWVGTFSKGLKIIDTHTKRIIKSYKKNNVPHSLVDNGIFSICKTSQGDIFLGTIFGLLRYNASVDGFDKVNELTNKFIYQIKEDSQGNLWFATYADGLYLYRATDKKWKNFRNDALKDNSIPSNKVLSVFEDSQRRIWITTQGGGFCKYNPENESFTTYNSSNGIPNDVVYDIQEDNEGKLWMTTNAGLILFNPSNNNINVYTTSNGLLSNQFNYRSGLKDNAGNIYFGSIDGFIKFDPKNFILNMTELVPVITDFMLFNKTVSPIDDESPLKNSIIFTDEITLKANQNTFSFRFASLDYISTNNNFMYKLDGFDKEWITVSKNHVASYANLNYGDYTLHVKVSNSDGLWSTKEKTVQIHILPPFYMTHLAFFIYFVLLVSTVTYGINYVKKVSQRNRRRQMEKFEQEKEREVYHAKIDFFTNVAHEIRTPLSLIKGPLENILLKNGLGNEIRKDLNIMELNTERLLNLTNQLLDFRKIESDGFRINFTKCNVSDIIDETYTRFTSLANHKGIIVSIELYDKDFYAHVSKEAFTKIISNLLNNGVKYSSSYLKIKLVVEDSVFHVITINDGRIIPLDMREEIFKPFIRYDDGDKMSVGTGIGLAMSRSLAELHNGSLKMTQNEDANEFILTMPIVQNNAISLDNELEKAEDDNIENTQYKLDEKFSDECETVSSNENEVNLSYTVLVIEDNVDMLSFIEQQLKEKYNVLTATNGKEALDVLEDNVVNIVVSDVMMPVMDGLELCSIIKQNVNFSHIPVILLTAKTNIQSKIEGMDMGADSYIDKPFSPEYLLAVISNLISNREKIIKNFANSPFIAANTMAITKADEKFLKKLNDIMMNNISNPDFNMDDMADNLYMSRSSFYRKIKGVLDLTPNEYLRIERLKRAAVLLKEGENRVHEICYMVGFSSPSYFSKCFLKQFGVLPKDFVEKK